MQKPPSIHEHPSHSLACLFAFNANISCIRRPFKANPKWTRIFLRVEFHFTSNFILLRIQRCLYLYILHRVFRWILNKFTNKTDFFAHFVRNFAGKKVIFLVIDRFFGIILNIFIEIPTMKRNRWCLNKNSWLYGEKYKRFPRKFTGTYLGNFPFCSKSTRKIMRKHLKLQQISSA